MNKIRVILIIAACAILMTQMLNAGQLMPDLHLRDLQEKWCAHYGIYSFHFSII
ncbi:MAG: hypothetical protein LBJ92_03905 [Holosporales bacterium]|nr:hypothetical protein [Holosporales bacterium]